MSFVQMNETLCFADEFNETRQSVFFDARETPNFNAPGSTVSKRSRIFTFEQCKEEEDERSEKEEGKEMETQTDTIERVEQSAQTEKMVEIVGKKTDWSIQKNDQSSYIGTAAMGVVVVGTKLFYKRD